MTKILLVCTAGMSTSALVQKMKKSALDKELELDIEAVPEAIADEFVGIANVVLLGPQIKYLQPKLVELFEPTPVEPINMMDYGMMNGEKVLDFALSLLEK